MSATDSELVDELQRANDTIGNLACQLSEEQERAARYARERNELTSEMNEMRSLLLKATASPQHKGRNQ